jgi:hypothetical protein
VIAIMFHSENSYEKVKDLTSFDWYHLRTPKATHGWLFSFCVRMQLWK